MIELLCQGVGARGVSVDMHIQDMYKLCVGVQVGMCEREFKVMGDAVGRDYGTTYCDLGSV